MNGRRPFFKMFKRPPAWNFPIWYFLLVILLLWLWQGVIGQALVHKIPYSEFKARLTRKEVIDCIVKDETIDGRLVLRKDLTPLEGSALTNRFGPISGTNFFMTVRVDDPKLTKELEQEGVKF